MQPSAGCVRRQPLVWMQMLVAWRWFPWRPSNQRRLAYRPRPRLRSIDRRRRATRRRRRAARRRPLTLESNSIWSTERRRRPSPCARPHNVGRTTDWQLIAATWRSAKLATRSSNSRVGRQTAVARPTDGRSLMIDAMRQCSFASHAVYALLQKHTQCVEKSVCGEDYNRIS